MNNNRSHLIIGVILITIGALLMISNFTDIEIGWSYFGPGILMVIGILFFTSIKTRQRSGAVFPGVIFFLTGLALFLVNFPVIYDFLINVKLHTFVMFLLAAAFFALYLTRPKEMGLLIPTSIFAVLGTFFILKDFWIIDEVIIQQLWPIIPIVIGMIIVIHGLRKKTPDPNHAEIS